jgi:parvulin-like peptidyl-prolyl isomerase
MKLSFLCFGLILNALVANSQNDSRVLFTIGNEKVTVGEFEYIYRENSIRNNDQANYSEQSLKDYLTLYENFRLKVKEAEALRLDTISSLKTELDVYRKQLAKNYLTDREISDQLIQEAYDRSLKEVHAAHILVKCDEHANPADSLAAYKKITDIRKRIMKGEDFGKLAQELSDDPSAKQNKGDIGYFTVFQTVYPFESAVYTTKLGDLSMPVRTKYGYHLVKVIADRPAQGEIHVTHILRKFPDNATPVQKEATRKTIDSINVLLTKGKISFDDAVIAFSEDITSKNKNGELPWFGTGRMVPEFEAAAFALKADGAVSAPIQTAYGWHIIKRLERKTLPSFNEVKYEIKKKVEKDNRSALAKSNIDESLLEYKNPEFVNLIREYWNGLLIFELTDRKVWRKSINDKAGRDLFLQNNRDKYRNGEKDSFLVSDYQEYLEKKWLSDLRVKYPITIDNIVFSSLINNPSQKDKRGSVSLKAPSDLPINNSPPAILEVKNIKFVDPNNNNRIDANEKCYISFDIVNTGKGAATKFKTFLKNKSTVSGLNFTSTSDFPSDVLPTSNPNQKIYIQGTNELVTGVAIFEVSFQEERGFTPDPFTIKIETREFSKPQVKVVDYSFLSDLGKVKLGFPVQLKCMIQNIGQGEAEEVKVEFMLPENVFPNNERSILIGNLEAGKSKEVVFEFIPNKLYKESSIAIKALVSEKYGKYSQNEICTIKLEEVTKGTSITVESIALDIQKDIQIASLSSDVDKNIPETGVTKPNTYALIIGNEDYSSFQNGLSKEVNVDYALNDARIFKEYCTKTLGIPERQIKLLPNATSGQMNQALAWINNLSKVDNGKAELVFYYSGHGLPDEITKEPYLIPVDVSGSNIAQGVRLADVYTQLTQYPSQKVTVFLDACFSGGARNQGLLAMKSIKVKAKDNVLAGNMVVFTSSSGEESSGVDREKQHGYLTYYLLKKLQETKGDVTYGQLGNYITETVKKETALRGKIQTPQVNYSAGVANSWSGWKMK